MLNKNVYNKNEVEISFDLVLFCSAKLNALFLIQQIYLETFELNVCPLTCAFTI